MRIELLVSPLQISVISSAGSEYIWASLFRKALREQLRNKKLKFVVGYDEDKSVCDTTSYIKEPLFPLNISNKFYYKFSLIYNLCNCIYLLNRPKILWHFLPFTFGHTFNLGIVFRLSNKCIIGPIQPSLSVQDIRYDKNNSKDLLTSFISIFRGIFFYLSRLTLKKADIVFVCTEEQKMEMIENGIDKNKIIVIGLGTVLINKKEKAIKKTKIKIICSGWFTSRKNQLEIIDAVNNLSNNIIKNIEISFYGEGPLLEDVIKKCNPKIKKSIRFFGKQPRDQVLAALRESDILLSTSMAEGYSQSALEAVGAGMALISTPVGGFKEIIQEARNGIIVNYNSESVGKAITELVLNRRRLHTYKQRSYDYAKLHTWEKQVERMLYLIYK